MITRKEIAQRFMNLDEAGRQAYAQRLNAVGMRVLEDYSCYAPPEDYDVARRLYGEDGSYKTTEFICVFGVL